MTRHDDRKARVRERMAETGEPYTVAARALAVEDEIAAADGVEYDPAFDGAATSSTIPHGVMRAMGMVAGAGPDCYELSVNDPTAEGGPAGRLAMVARGFIHDGDPALLVESVEILERHNRLPGLWWNAMSIDLHELGWRYFTEGQRHGSVAGGGDAGSRAAVGAGAGPGA